jgi:hypothetical protein
MRDIYMVADDVVAFLGPATPGLGRDDKAGAFLDISRRPYWDRLWIIQEFVLGKNLKLQCGHLCLDWNSFSKEFPKDRDIRAEGKQMLRLFDFKKRYNAERYGIDIAEAIKFALNSQASDPRDKVYGVMGLVQTSSRLETLRADYNLSACQVYQQAAD